MVDPQRDEDENVQRHRPDGDDAGAREGAPLAEVAARWRRYAVSEHWHAGRLRAEGEQPFDQLRDVRGRTRSAAAEVLEAAGDRQAAAEEMMRRVRALYVLEPPFVGFDEAMLAYTEARTWQACARELCSEITEVQPAWTAQLGHDDGMSPSTI